MALQIDGAEAVSDTVLDAGTPEEQVADLVDAVRRHPERRRLLVDLLSERHPVYAGRSANATIRIRGYILAAFEEVGLPDAALVYVIEELESGRDAYLVAAAAKAVRGLDTREGGVVPFLFKAVDNVRDVDDAVTFATYKPRWPLSDHTTALGEILRTFAWLGGHGQAALSRLEALHEDGVALPDATRAAIRQAIEAIRAGDGAVDAGCCGPSGGIIATRQAPAPAERGALAVPAGVEFEDQSGRRLSYADFFIERPSIVVFFYTRCTNPNKCSLTITKLARLQEVIPQTGLKGRLKTAAITYDPEFDLPPRLRTYGLNRGIVFSDDDRFLRATGDFELLREYFELGVSFGPAVVNRHRIELFLVDHAGRVVESFSRLQWEADEVLRSAASILDAG